MLVIDFIVFDTLQFSIFNYPLYTRMHTNVELVIYSLYVSVKFYLGEDFPFRLTSVKNDHHIYYIFRSTHIGVRGRKIERIIFELTDVIYLCFQYDPNVIVIVLYILYANFCKFVIDKKINVCGSRSRNRTHKNK